MFILACWTLQAMKVSIIIVNKKFGASFIFYVAAITF